MKMIEHFNELIEDTEYVFKIGGELTCYTMQSFFYKGPVHDGPDGIIVYESETPLMFSDIQEIHTEGLSEEDGGDPCFYYEDYMMDMLEL